MSHTPQQPADGWQPPQNQPPVYRPNEQPPNEEPPPWSPESQRMSQSGPQGSVEEDGTVKYVGGPGQQQVPGYGPPPGVPVSPFDAPSQSPQHMPAADPFGGGGGVPVSGMPVSGMPPVSSIPASGMPVSGMPVSAPGGPGQYGQPPFGGGQFGPQGGQLVPVSGGGAQPWGAPDTIKRKDKKKGGKGPMWLLVAGIVVIAAALGVGGFILFNPDGNPTDDKSGTIASASVEPEASVAEPEAPTPVTVLADQASGLSILAPEGSPEAATPPEGFSGPTGTVLGESGPTVFFGALDPAAIGVAEDVPLDTLGTNLQNLAATWAGGAAEGAEATQYRVDGRAAEFRTFTVGDVTVMTAIIEDGGNYVGFVGSATADQVEALEAARSTLSFGS